MRSKLVKEASDIVRSEDRSQKAMERIKQLHDQATSIDDKLIIADLFEAFLVDGGIAADLQRMAKS